MFERFIFPSILFFFVFILTACSAGNEPAVSTTSAEQLDNTITPTAGNKLTSTKKLLKTKFNDDINKPILQTCVSCHSDEGIASNTRLRLTLGVSDDTLTSNAAALSAFPDTLLFLNKASNQVIHAGASALSLDVNASEFLSLSAFFADETRYFEIESIIPADTASPEQIEIVDDTPTDPMANVDDILPVETSAPVDAIELPPVIDIVEVMSLNTHILQAKCVACHSLTGIAQSTRLLFTQGESEAEISNNEAVISEYISGVTNGSQVLLAKPLGFNHVGGTVFSIDSKEYGLLNDFINQLLSENPVVSIDPEQILPISNLNSSVIQATCIACHSATGPAKNTRLRFIAGNDDTAVLNNEIQISDFIASVSNGAQLVLDKPRGLGIHGGGEVLALGSAEYTLLKEFVDINTPTGNQSSVNQVDYILESPAQTYRRASLYFKGEIPTRNKILSLQNVSDEDLRLEVLALMQGDGFHQFLKNAANSRIHSRQVKTTGANVRSFDKFYKPNINDKEDIRAIRKDLAEEPLELIAYVVENDLPYSEILTADYLMVSQYTDEAYNTGLDLQEGEWRKAKNIGQDIKSAETAWSTATGENRITDYPHAGILTSWAYLSRYATSATNRNRARAAWTMRHFLGFDVEASVSRELNAADVADESNPTLNNPACTACHAIMDPVASAFKYYGEYIGYKRYGTDSLDRLYRNENPGVDWYQDMLDTGFNGEAAPAIVDPLQWLAQKITEDERFASATVKFWWRALFGQDILESSAPRVQFDAQSRLINQLADAFRPQLQLKELLADMVMSDAFRVERKSSDSITDDAISIQGSAKHLLGNDQLLNKTRSLTGFVWNENNPNLKARYYALYGGTDDLNVDERPENISTIMYRVAESQAYNISCAAVINDFSFSQNERRLFTEVERNTLDETQIRKQIVVLYERLLNRFVSTVSVDVNNMYKLFLDLRQLRVNQGNKTNINSYTQCSNIKSGSIDDQYFVLGPWRAILISFMSDIDYVYE